MGTSLSLFFTMIHFFERETHTQPGERVTATRNLKLSALYLAFLDAPNKESIMLSASGSNPTKQHHAYESVRLNLQLFLVLAHQCSQVQYSVNTPARIEHGTMHMTD
jgi:hypothetical protein